MKNYIGISRDHSGSMYSLTSAATRDYNSNIEAIKQAASNGGQDTVVSIVRCGVGQTGRVEREVTNCGINTLRLLNERDYRADGGRTPLFDSVGDLIRQFESSPDAKDPNVSFLVMAITDGHNNATYDWTAQR